MHRRLVHDASAGCHRLADREPAQDHRRAVVDPVVEFDQRDLLHRQRLYRIGDFRLGCRVAERDDLLFRHLLGGYGSGYGNGDSHLEFRDVPRQEVRLKSSAARRRAPRREKKRGPAQDRALR